MAAQPSSRARARVALGATGSQNGQVLGFGPVGPTALMLAPFRRSERATQIHASTSTGPPIVPTPSAAKRATDSQRSSLVVAPRQSSPPEPPYALADAPLDLCRPVPKQTGRQRAACQR